MYNKAILSIIACCIAFVSVLSLSACKKDVLKPQSYTALPSLTEGELNKITFIDENRGYIVGGSRYAFSDILTTSDGGKTWELFNMGLDGKKSIFGLSAFGDRTYGVGFDGKIFIKPAPDAQWHYIQTNWWECFTDVTFTEGNKGFVTAGVNFRNGRIFQIDSIGAVVTVDSFDYELSDINFPDIQTGYACGYGAVLKTEDAGKSWTLLNVKGDFFKSMSCLDVNHIWMVGYNGSIMHTSDGGNNWKKLRDGNNPLLKKYRFRAVLFKDLNNGYAVGDKGLIVKTTDGGEHWSEFERLTDNDLRCLTFHPDGSLWVAGAKGVIFRIME